MRSSSPKLSLSLYPFYSGPLSLLVFQSLVSRLQRRSDTWISVAVAIFLPVDRNLPLYTLALPLSSCQIYFSLEGKEGRAWGEHICYLFKNLSARLLCDFGASFCACLLSLCCAVRFILFVKWILPLLLFRFRVQPEKHQPEE